MRTRGSVAWTSAARRIQVRGEFSPEDFLVPHLARRLGRPVKLPRVRAALD
jgi:hypothetical protein